MRVFFALVPDAATAMRIADWRDLHTSCDGQPVSPSNFHITLAFAGELTDHAIESLCEAVEERMIPSAPGPSHLVLDSVGYWPRPGIFWLGATNWPAELSGLAQGLRHLAVTAGARRDRKRFLPHVTLYRRCRGAPPAPRVEPAFAFEYGQFALCESRQGRRGVHYHTLHEWDLTDQGPS